MAGMTGRGGVIYEFTMVAKVCACPHPPIPYATGRKADRVIERAESCWSLYQAFFVDGLEWLLMEVTDVRDGHVIWRNGAHLQEDDSGKLPIDPTDQP